MEPVVVDSSVWVAAADPIDRFHQASAEFLKQIAIGNHPVATPTYARIEIACALARRLQDAEQARNLAASGLSAVRTNEIPMDTDFLRQALVTGTEQLLRGADALFAATAATIGGELISWDQEHLNRAGARSPSDWLNQRTSSRQASPGGWVRPKRK